MAGTSSLRKRCSNRNNTQKWPGFVSFLVENFAETVRDDAPHRATREKITPVFMRLFSQICPTASLEQAARSYITP